MQRLDFDLNEKISRKEYLKRKKRQAKSLKKRSKLTYIFLGVTLLLSIYVMTQFYVYSKANNYKYVAGDDVNKQKVYNLYYITEGYTYNPKYTLNSINSDGFNDKTVYDNIGIADIISTDKYVYGIKDTGLYRLNKENSNLENVVQKDVNKYTIYNDEIYVIVGQDNKLEKIDSNTKEVKDLNLNNVAEILVDESNVFVAVIDGTQKNIYKIDKDGSNKLQLTKNSNASYMVQDGTKIYYVNKNDSSKIYSISKDGQHEEKIADITCLSDNGTLKEIDGSKYMFVHNDDLYYINTSDSNNLWKINLKDKSKSVVLQMSVQILQNIDNTVFYKVKGEMGVNLYNYDTKFMSQVTKNNVSDFYVDNGTIDNSVNQQNIQDKN